VWPSGIKFDHIDPFWNQGSIFNIGSPNAGTPYNEIVLNGVNGAVCPTVAGLTCTGNPANHLQKVAGQTSAAYAPAGYVGEHKAITGSVTATASGTVYQVASVSLTPGVWEVWGTLQSVPGTGTTTTQLGAAFSASSASTTSVSGDIDLSWIGAATNGYLYLPIGHTILIVPTTATYYMNAYEYWGTAAPTLNVTGAAWRIQ
jgi:hypothetical protein